MTDPKSALLATLQTQRDAMVWKLDGLSERQVRWPGTPTGTNLLGLVKHVAYVERGYFALAFGRPADDFRMPDEDDDPNADFWATAEQAAE